MKRLLAFAFALMAGLQISAQAQIRIERDREGQIVVTNRGAARSSSEAEAGPASNARPSPRLTPGEKREIKAKLRTACDRRGLDYNLVAALVMAESGFQQHTLSRKGAIGLMQLMPATARRFGASDPWDLDQNIEGGTAYLGYLNSFFNGDIPLILAGYNAGENAVMKYSRKIPPYAETVRYVFRILHDYGRPSLITDAKELLAQPGDYDRFYVPMRNWRAPTRTYYMYFDAEGVRHIADYPPSGFKLIPIVYKDE